VSALAGLGVLVTRPQLQAGNLCRLIEAEGGTPIRFPALEIRPRTDRAATRAAVGPIDRYQLIVFVSSNAVRYGADMLGQRRDLRIAAIGTATAQALNAAGHRVAVLPVDGSDSEALLHLPELQHLDRQRVLIVRGTGGRELLAETFTARGAEVVYAEVYERRCAEPSVAQIAELESLWSQGGVHVYTATSTELLENLIDILTPAGKELLQNTPMLTGAKRVAEAEARLGIRSPVIQADGPSDATLVGALVRWRRQQVA
jgi:uroporphyrinogen-III synthase